MDYYYQQPHILAKMHYEKYYYFISQIKELSLRESHCLQSMVGPGHWKQAFGCYCAVLCSKPNPELNTSKISVRASLIAQLVKILPAMQETMVQFLDWEDILEKGWETLSSILGLPWWLSGKEYTCNAGDLGSIPGVKRSPGGGHGNSLQYSCLENPHRQRSLADYSPWGRKEVDTAEWLNTTHSTGSQCMLIYLLGGKIL